MEQDLSDFIVSYRKRGLEIHILQMRRHEKGQKVRELLAVIGRMKRELFAFRRTTPDLLAAAQLALQNLHRNLASEEACGSPFMGDGDHEAIAVLASAIAKATQP